MIIYMLRKDDMYLGYDPENKKEIWTSLELGYGYTEGCYDIILDDQKRHGGDIIEFVLTEVGPQCIE